MFLQDKNWATTKNLDDRPSKITAESNPQKQSMDQEIMRTSHLYSKPAFLKTEAQIVIDLEERQTQTLFELTIQNHKRFEMLERKLCVYILRIMTELIFIGEERKKN